MTARARRERLDLYRDELIYLLVKRHYQGVTTPTEMSEKLMKPSRRPKPAKKVIADVIRKLG